VNIIPIPFLLSCASASNDGGSLRSSTHVRLFADLELPGGTYETLAYFSAGCFTFYCRAIVVGAIGIFRNYSDSVTG
jgi:hypothetical protein